MIRPFQTSITPVGHFDFLDTELAGLKGGEVAVLDQILTSNSDKTSPDTFGETYRLVARLANKYDEGPFYFTDSRGNSWGAGEVGFENVSLFSTAGPYLDTADAAGKIGLWVDEGFYSITVDAVESTITADTPINTSLYVSANGKLTTVPSQSNKIAAHFIEYRAKSFLDSQRNKFNYHGTSKRQDTIIVYKLNADGYGGSGDTFKIGIPSDGTYTDGLLDIDSKTTLSDAIDQINEALLSIAPEEAGLLTGQDLVLSGTTTYSAVLPSGLDSAWYPGGESPGDTVTGYIVDPTYTLTSPDQATRWRAGKASDPSTAGIITHVINGVDVSERNIGEIGEGLTGTLFVDDISTYNNIWLKANGYLTINHTGEGKETHALKSSVAGQTNAVALYYDDTNTAPTFSSAASQSPNTAVTGYLSGIQHYALNSTFDVSYTAASGIFEKAYHPTAVSQISHPAGTTVVVNPSSVPAVGDTLVVTDELFTLDTADIARETSDITVTLQKPNGDSATSTVALAMPVNTYGTTSTTTAEYFTDEAQRLTGLNSTSPDWTSSTAITDGYAQVRITDSGTEVGYADLGDYSGFSGTQQVYQRHFSKTSTPNASLTFTGINYTDIDVYGSGDLNLIIKLDVDNICFDAGLPFGAVNGDGSGDSYANSIGCQVGTSSGTRLDISFGTRTTATNNNRYRTIFIFKNRNHYIQQIISS